MLRGDLPPRARRHADHERHADLSARHVPQRRRVVEDLIEREQAEVHGHDLDDRAHPGDRRADARADERRLRERRVADALGPELRRAARGCTRSVPPYLPTSSPMRKTRGSFCSASRSAARDGLAVGRRGSLVVVIASSSSRVDVLRQVATGSSVPASANATAAAISSSASRSSVGRRRRVRTRPRSLASVTKSAIGSRSLPALHLLLRRDRAPGRTSSARGSGT